MAEIFCLRGELPLHSEKWREYAGLVPKRACVKGDSFGKMTEQKRRVYGRLATGTERETEILVGVGSDVRNCGIPHGVLWHYR